MIAMSVKNVLDVEYLDLRSLLESAKLHDSVQDMLPQYLVLSLTNGRGEVRSQALDLLMHLSCSAGYCQLQCSGYIGLLVPTHDTQLISRLADIAIKDDEPALRKTALKLLKSLFDQIRFQDLVKSTLSELVEQCFTRAKLTEFRRNAIAVLHDLTDPNVNGDRWYAKFEDIVSPSLLYLLKIAVFAGDGAHNFLRGEAQALLLENLPLYSSQTRLNLEVLSAVPTMISTIAEEDKWIVLKLGENLHLSDVSAAAIARALIPLLRAPSLHSRGTALELLARLYTKHRSAVNDPSVINSAISGTVDLALDRRDVAGRIRQTAVTRSFFF
ncbi:hypothetical protein FA13DRAFT_10449 [Coprinellus micaceus]|uniref:ARM repeat-containing protein n=1 Tax=Coprinellus micaceus TaxID=71717 RepID=A0A4Y7TZH1_COPMI|nr:hypothetical protein FA13DRAFT_10449 [Coprinellus micaceus]